MDAGPIHLITTAGLRWLQQQYPMATIDARRFRPNLLLDVPGTHRVEHDWIGKRLYLGNQVQLQVTELTERCAMVGFAQDDLPDDGRILKAILRMRGFANDRDMTRRFGRHFGVYAKVVPGMIVKGEVYRSVEAIRSSKPHSPHDN